MICFKNFKKKLFPESNSKQNSIINVENIMEKEIKSPTNNKNIQNLNINMKNNKKDEQENQNNSQFSQNYSNHLKKMSLLGDSNTLQTNYADLRRSLTEKYPYLSSENTKRSLIKKQNSYLLDKNEIIPANNFMKVNSVSPNGNIYNSKMNDYGRKFG